MKDSVKALYCKITAIVLTVIMVLLLVSCFLPIAKVRTAGRPIDDGFSTGRFTSGVTIPEVDLGIGSAISFLGDFKMASTIISVQNNDQLIKVEQENLRDYILGGGQSESTIDSYNDRIEAYQKENAETLAELTPEELESIPELMNDEGFLKSLGVYYGFIAMFSDYQFEEVYPDYAENSIHMLIFIFGIIAFAVAVVTLVVYLIISVIQLIVKGVYFGTHVKNADENLLNKMYPKAIAGVAGIIFIVMLLLVTLNGYGITFGCGAITMFVCYIIANAIRGLNKIMLADAIDWERVVKFGITFIAVLLLFAIIVCFVNVGIFATTMEDGPDYMDAHYEAVYKVEYEAKLKECPCADCTGNNDLQEQLRAPIDHAKHINDSIDYARSVAKTAAKDTVKTGSMIALGFDVVFMLIMGIGFICFVERLGDKEYKPKGSDVAKKYGAMPIVGILLAILFIVPNFLFGVGTVEDRKVAYEEGSIKILFDDYDVEDTKANLEYKLLVKTEEEMVKAIDELDTSAEKYEATKLHADRALLLVQDRIDMVETSQKSSLIMGTIWAVLLAASSFVYMNASKVAKLFPAKAAEDNADAEGDAEAEAPAEGDAE